MSLSEPRIPTSIPSGTRDLLPEELRELRGITRSIEDCFAASGYGEVRTPTLELESAHNSELAAYRFIDEQGNTLVLRSDMTVPIARVALTRFAGSGEPLRLSYLERSWRRTKAHSGEGREILQAGAELIGAESAGVTEVVELCAKALSAAGLQDWRIALGDAGILDSALEGLELDTAEALRKAVVEQDLVTVDRLADEAGNSELGKLLRYREPAETFLAKPSAFDTSAESQAELRELVEALSPEVRSRVIVDFSLSSPLDYYSGIVFSVYEPTVGRAIGGGGSYDSLFEEAGSQVTGCGFALDIDLLHQALAGEARGESLP